MAGNIESHTTLDKGEKISNITAVLDQTHFGLSKMTFYNQTALKWEFIRGDDGSVGDYLYLLKDKSPTPPDTCERD
jgi:acid phosphatase